MMPGGLVLTALVTFLFALAWLAHEMRAYRRARRRDEVQDAE